MRGNRRGFLGGVALAGVLVGCGPRSQAAAVQRQRASTFDPVGQVAPDADEVLSVLSGSFEQLVGSRPFAFGLTDLENRPVTSAEVEVWVVPASGGATTGPFPARFHEAPTKPWGCTSPRSTSPSLAPPPSWR